MVPKAIRVLTVAALLLVVVGTTACSAEPGQPVATSSTDRACTDTTGLTDARSGDIAAGPFRENTDFWTAPHGTKLWVASVRAEDHDADAIIDAHLVGGSAAVRATRTPGATVETFPTFFPGALRLPVAGLWRLDVTIGASQGCFTLEVQ